APAQGMMRHFLSSADLTRDAALQVFQLAADLKQRWKAGRRGTPLAGRTMALIFEKPSLRTRVTFEVGIVQLGGRAVYLSGAEIGLGTRESVPDAARRLGGRVEVTEDARKAAAGADVIYTDVWTSMGQEAERARRQEAFSRYQVNETIVGFAKPSVLVMHCLPAHRGEEITDA